MGAWPHKSIWNVLGRLQDTRLQTRDRLNKRARALVSRLRSVPVAGGQPESVVPLPAGEIGAIRSRVQASTWEPFPGVATSSAWAGEQASPFRGGGMEFEELRRYHPGDDVRAIDWQVTARTGEPHVRVFQEERRALRYVITDMGPGMFFATRGSLKLQQAARLAAAFLFQGLASHRRQALSVLGPEVRIMSTGSGEESVRGFLEALSKSEPVPADGSAYLSRGLAFVEPRLPVAGAEVVLISDFRSMGEADWRILRRLAYRQRVLAVRILDPAEKELPAVGRCRFRSPATGREQWVDTASRRVRRQMEGSWKEALEAQARGFRQSGISLVDIRTDEPVLAALERIVVRG